MHWPCQTMLDKMDGAETAFSNNPKLLKVGQIVLLWFNWSGRIISLAQVIVRCAFREPLGRVITWFDRGSLDSCHCSWRVYQLEQSFGLRLLELLLRALLLYFICGRVLLFDELSDKLLPLHVKKLGLRYFRRFMIYLLHRCILLNGVSGYLWSQSQSILGIGFRACLLWPWQDWVYLPDFNDLLVEKFRPLWLGRTEGAFPPNGISIGWLKFVAQIGSFVDFLFFLNIYVNLWQLFFHSADILVCFEEALVLSFALCRELRLELF